ncbi:MAG: serine/threonine protein kinase [Myxococcaceae bacterium]|nr:serine/threonine protein kinase [Myxococcaceae bacterium]
MQTIGRYELVRRLGRGGMAEVFLARASGPQGFSKQLVLKLILPAFADDPKFVELFFREAKIAARLNHPNIVQVFDFGSADDEHFLAMEYVDGLTLREILKRTWGVDRPPPVPVALKLLSPALSALQYAHGENVIHRDISPDNLLVSKAGAVKLSDFGLARAVDATHSTTLRGKYGYLAPELMSGQGRCDHRADLFSFGVVLFEALTGRRPFGGATELAVVQSTLYAPHPRPSELRPDVPAALDALVDGLLEKAPERRLGSARSALGALEAVLGSWPPVRTSDISKLAASAST